MAKQEKTIKKEVASLEEQIQKGIEEMDALRIKLAGLQKNLEEARKLLPNPKKEYATEAERRKAAVESDRLARKQRLDKDKLVRVLLGETKKSPFERPWGTRNRNGRQ